MTGPPTGDGLDRLSRTARALSAGPLGLVALFLVLVYGMAALVLGVGLFRGPPELMTPLVLPLVWFLVSFPVLVLAVFTWLVAYHTEKLYPPSEKPMYLTKKSPPTRAVPPKRPRRPTDPNPAEPAPSTGEDQ